MNSVDNQNEIEIGAAADAAADADADIDVDLPPTPLHPAPNEEINNQLPQGKLQSSNIDLNPDLYDEEEEKTPDNDKIETDNSNILLDQLSETELEDVNINLNQVTLSFDQAYESLKINFYNNKSQSLSESQQSKFINYLDEELLKVQRNFIKQQSGESTNSLIDLISDLNPILELLFVSISPNANLFAQVSYYIKILGDFEDFINHYNVLFEYNNISQIAEFFKFIQNLDLSICLLIDGYENINNHKVQKFNMTELTRLFPIVSRIRILIIEKVDNQRRRNRKPNEMIDNLLELEISRIFEGILTRDVN
ncbi:unnamed protein product [Candida verbasci]|uniref:Uncharacterized protein n=1 Tax=Candida verbasci TaxID=1227364 RepID=A0A9W4TVH5_9ASCO|nr:unnamed protein product [Candida verbasci]